jgi:hypothetical protein
MIKVAERELWFEPRCKRADTHFNPAMVVSRLEALDLRGVISGLILSLSRQFRLTTQLVNMYAERRPGYS